MAYYNGKKVYFKLLRFLRKNFVIGYALTCDVDYCVVHAEVARLGRRRKVEVLIS